MNNPAHPGINENGGNMYGLLIIVLGLVGMFVIVGGVAYFLQNRANRNGNLFTRAASPSARILAFLLGLLFGCIFIYEYFYTQSYSIEFPILAFALLAYALGAGRILEEIQKIKH
jgi:uncharacterized membrane protein HdeD (DUF308 family)